MVNKWSREKIISALQEIDRTGNPTNSSYLPRPLRVAIVRYFESTEKARKAAHVKPQELERRTKWTRDNILKEIQRMKSQGEEFSPGYLQKYKGGLVDAARKKFGSFDDAVLAAGHDPDEDKKIKRWEDAQILMDIYLLHEMGISLNPGSVLEAYASLQENAVLHFGSWRFAVQEAGFNYDLIKRDALTRRKPISRNAIPKEPVEKRISEIKNSEIKYIKETHPGPKTADVQKNPAALKTSKPMKLESEIEKAWIEKPRYSLKNPGEAYQLFLSSGYPQTAEGERDFYRRELGCNPNIKYCIGSIVYLSKKRKFGRIVERKIIPLEDNIIEVTLTLQLINTKKEQKVRIATKKKLS